MESYKIIEDYSTEMSAIAELLTKADQAFTNHQYVNGEQLQEKALEKITTSPLTNEIIELLAIHFFRCAYLSAPTDTLTAENTINMRKQFKKGFEYIDKLPSNKINSENLFFFAQASFASAWQETCLTQNITNAKAAMIRANAIKTIISFEEHAKLRSTNDIKFADEASKAIVLFSNICNKLLSTEKSESIAAILNTTSTPPTKSTLTSTLYYRRAASPPISSPNTLVADQKKLDM